MTHVTKHTPKSGRETLVQIIFFNSPYISRLSKNRSMWAYCTSETTFGINFFFKLVGDKCHKMQTTKQSPKE